MGVGDPNSRGRERETPARGGDGDGQLSPADDATRGDGPLLPSPLSSGRAASRPRLSLPARGWPVEAHLFSCRGRGRRGFRFARARVKARWTLRSTSARASFFFFGVRSQEEESRLVGISITPSLDSFPLGWVPHEERFSHGFCLALLMKR